MLRVVQMRPASLTPSASASLAKIVADPAFAEMSGKYLQSNDGILLVARSSKASYDEDTAKKLWEDSMLLAGGAGLQIGAA